MGSSGSSGAKGGVTADVLLAGAVGLLALPSAVLAFSAGFESRIERRASGEAVEPLKADPAPVHLARPIPIRT